MPLIEFDQLPDDGRVWVFAADRKLDDSQVAAVLATVDEFLVGWAAHGTPLRSGRAMRDGRFLAVGVDQSTAGASGCSIDGLFRSFKSLSADLGANLLTGGRLFWRDDDWIVRSSSRQEFKKLAASGSIGEETPVFDTALTTVGAWRERFELPAGASWHLGV